MKYFLLTLLVMVYLSSQTCFGLNRTHAKVNIDDAPIEVLEFDRWEMKERPGDNISSVVKCKNRTDRDIEAFSITMIYYNPFNEQEDGLRAISTRALKANEEMEGGWSIYGDPTLVRTAVVFVDRVRFTDGEVWRTDLEEVLEVARNMPELGFLSFFGIEMLEFRKE